MTEEVLARLEVLRDCQRPRRVLRREDIRCRPLSVLVASLVDLEPLSIRSIPLSDPTGVI
jgi:hypothetical protein